MAKKILIIEDDEVNLKLFSEILNYNDYEPLQAKNGMEGIRIAMIEKPHLILTDLHMPVMDGFKVLRILKSDTSTKDIPCIAVSVIKERKEKFLKLGFADYIAKPFDMHELISIVNKHLR